MQKTDTQNAIAREAEALKRIYKAEDIAEKKMRIYSRLLMDATLAKDMESLAEKSEERKKSLKSLLGKKPDEKKSETGEEE